MQATTTTKSIQDDGSVRHWEKHVHNQHTRELINTRKTSHKGVNSHSKDVPQAQTTKTRVDYGNSHLACV